MLRACGTLALVGLGALTADLPVGLIMAKGLRVRGVVEGDSDPHVFIPRLADLWRSGELPIEKLVTTFASTRSAMRGPQQRLGGWSNPSS